MTQLSSSSSIDIGLGDKLAEWKSALLDAWYRVSDPRTDADPLADFEEYDAMLARHAARRLKDSRVLEIGYGARPLRLIAAISLGIDARGIDLDVPVLRGRPAEFIEMYRRNGFERAIKSALRFMMFDSIERRRLRRELAGRGTSIQIKPDRFMVGDAGALDLPDGALDLIFSEDVFEHIPTDSIGRLCEKMRRWLKPGGLALIRPNIFTGIVGGHLLEWSIGSFQRRKPTRRSDAWEHLRRRRYRPNTYLNELRRRDYRELFGRQFAVVEEVVRRPGLGREMYDASAAAELRAYSEEELFSNQVMFVLKPKA